MTFQTINPLRRRALPLATALVATALTGCMGAHQTADAPHVLTPEEQAAKNISDFIDGADAAIDHAPESTKPVPTTRRYAAISDADDPLLAAVAPPSATQPATAAATTKPAVAGDGVSAMSALSVPLPAGRPMPLPMQQTIAAQPTIDQAMAVLREEAAAHPALTTTLALALLDSAQGRAPNARAAARLSEPDQKLLGDLLSALEGMTPVSTAATLADRASPLVDAAQKWQADADLSLPKVTLASRVDSFGVYAPLDPKFSQGVATTVILYCEVAHFASHRTDDGHYETNLSQQDTLLTADGLLLWRPTTEDVNDRSLNQRHDFYLVKKITLPDTLAAGKYTLRLQVTDRTVNKIATFNMPIEITAN
jgi:hypothetical protein